LTSRRGSNAYKGKTPTKREDPVSLDQARRYRLVRSVDRIELICPKGGEKKEDTVDLSYLLVFPHLSEPFAQAVQEIWKSKTFAYATCFKMALELKNGFLAFLKEKSLTNIRVEQLTTSHIQGFKNWLDRTDNMGVAIYGIQSRVQRMSHLRQVVQYLKQSDKWAPQLNSDLHVRRGMWAGQKGSGKPTPIIQAEDYQKIYQACKKEIIEIIGRVKTMRASLQANLDHPAALAPEPAERPAYDRGNNSRNRYSDLGVLLATLHRRYPRKILTKECLDASNDRALASAVMKRNISAITACFYPSARDLVPFILLMAIHLDYNKATLMGSKVSDYRILAGKLRPEFVASASLIEEEEAAESTKKNEGEKMFRVRQ
jgi:hypothetical protein